MDNEKQLVELLKKLSKLLKNFLQVTNENQHLLKLILKLRELLSHEHHDLRAYLPLSHPDREPLGHAQEEQEHKYAELLELFKQLRLADRHLRHHEDFIRNRLKSLESYRKGLERDKKALEDRQEHGTQMDRRMAQRIKAFLLALKQTEQELLALRQYMDYLKDDAFNENLYHAPPGGDIIKQSLDLALGNLSAEVTELSHEVVEDTKQAQKDLRLLEQDLKLAHQDVQSPRFYATPRLTPPGK